MLHSLFEGEFDKYVGEIRAHDARAQQLWVFVHVPKTAGSSLHAEVGAILSPSANIDIDHTDTSRSYKERFDDSVQRFASSQWHSPARFVTGHINAAQVDMIRAQVPDLRCFTMLRHPVARIVSDYRFQRSAMNQAREDFVARTPSFAEYAARPYVHNKMAAHLVPRALFERGDVAECVQYILQNYAFVGLQEMYPLALRMLTTLMGETRAPSVSARVNPETEASRVVLSEADEQDLLGRNRLDLGIYRAFLTRWRDIRPALRLYLKEEWPVSPPAPSAQPDRDNPRAPR